MNGEEIYVCEKGSGICFWCVLVEKGNLNLNSYLNFKIFYKKLCGLKHFKVFQRKKKLFKKKLKVFNSKLLKFAKNKKER